MSQVPPDEAARLILQGRAPAGLKTGVLRLSYKDAKKAVVLPPGLSCFSLDLSDQSLTALPEDLQVEYKLNLTNCAGLTHLPVRLKVSTLILANCVALTSLPEHLDVNFLNLDGCTALRAWPESARVSCGWVRARGCAMLDRLPEKLGPLASLDLRGCRRLDRIPSDVSVLSWIDLADTRVNSLPSSLAGVAIRWRGVPITPQIAFFPETLTGAEVLAEPNTEVRRVMIERVGFEKFLREVNAEVIDKDRDPGGERRLLRVPLADDEPIVVVSVICPSTGRQYIVRVPPTMRTCRQAVAWTAGFDNPDDYAPVAET